MIRNRNQGHIQNPYGLSDVLCNFLSLLIPAKSSNLKCGRVPGSVFKNFAMHENYPDFIKKSVFFEMWPFLSKLIVLFCYFSEAATEDVL